MQDIDYKQKYLKYNAKYLELKKGGGKNGASLVELNKALSENKDLYIGIFYKRGGTSQKIFKKINSFKENKSDKVIEIVYDDGFKYVSMIQKQEVKKRLGIFTTTNLTVTNRYPLEIIDKKEELLKIVDKLYEDESNNIVKKNYNIGVKIALLLDCDCE